MKFLFAIGLFVLFFCTVGYASQISTAGEESGIKGRNGKIISPEVSEILEDATTKLMTGDEKGWRNSIVCKAILKLFGEIGQPPIISDDGKVLGTSVGYENRFLAHLENGLFVQVHPHKEKKGYCSFSWSRRGIMASPWDYGQNQDSKV